MNCPDLYEFIVMSQIAYKSVLKKACYHCAPNLLDHIRVVDMYGAKQDIAGVNGPIAMSNAIAFLSAEEIDEVLSSEYQSGDKNICSKDGKLKSRVRVQYHEGIPVRIIRIDGDVDFEAIQ